MIFSVPKSSYTDFYDIARFKLVWRLNIILIIFLPILGFTQTLLDKMSAVPSLIGAGIAFVILIVLKKTKSYFLSSLFFSLLGVILCQYTFLFFPEAYHVNDTLWMFVIVLFAFFTLGRKWGMIITILNLSGIVYFVKYKFNDNLESIKHVNDNDVIAISINFLICFLIIAYLINQFIQTSKFAENQYRILTKELQESNVEKTTMLKEIHHRVKNNLQVITSLLRLQSREIKDIESKTIYEESINRVIAMALIHEKMYQTENLAKINLEDYIRSLANDLLTSYSLKDSVTIEVESDIETINTKYLVPLALIFNELMTNSIKHAFENRPDGELNISIVNNESYITLIYSDNGEWKPSENEASFGMELIEALTEQLSGSYKRDFKNGTRYNFTFAPDK